MDNLNTVYTFFIIFVILWISLLGVTIYQTNRRILERKGYNEDFIELSKKINIKRNIGIGVIVTILGIFAALVVWAIFGDLNKSNHLMYVYLLWFLLIIPFPILESEKGGKEFKELAIKTNTDIVIDFKYKILHLVFAAPVEALFSIIYILYFIIFIEVFHVAFIHILILWFLYGSLRFSKSQTRPGIRDAYIFSFIFMVLNQSILIFHVLREVISRFACEGCTLSIALILGISLAAALICKLIYYLFKLPEFSFRLKNRSA